MINKPFVSILIPVYNRETIIKATLQSAISQDYDNFEIIVVDNCSTDGTWDVILEFQENNKNVIAFKNNSNIGPVRNWKSSLDLANGDLVTILWSDDLLKTNFLSESIPLISEDTAFVLPNISYINEDGALVYSSDINIMTKHKCVSITEYLNQILLLNLYNFPVSPCGSIFRKKDLIKSLLIEVENKDGLNFNKYGAGNDLLIFLITLSQANYKNIVQNEKVLVLFRIHQDSISIRNKNSISIYYDWAKLFFIKNYTIDSTLKSKFKSLILLRTIKYKNYRKSMLYKSINGKLDLLYIFKSILKK